MGTVTAITWTDHTFNPWWGCTKITDTEGTACDNCYAATLANRYGHDVWGKDKQRRTLSDANWAKPLAWERQAIANGRPHLVFCASMGDVFEHRTPDDLAERRSRLWELIEATPHLIWQLLTKRPEWVPQMVPMMWLRAWPPNVWVGVTVENQKYAEVRIPRLLHIPAPVRFLSCEPLLGPIDLSRWLHLEWMDALRMPDAPPRFRTEDGEGGWGAEMFATLNGDRADVDWIICGGESGAGYRPLDVRYARDLREQANAAGVPFFFKQVGGHTPTAGGDELDGATIKQLPAEACR